MNKTNLGPRVRFDGRELELCVILVHGFDLLPGGRSKNLDDFHQLIHRAFTREQGLAYEQLRKYTSQRPDIWRKV